jgi:hypothetical protein
VLLPSDEELWRVFEREFLSAFTDGQKKQAAHKEFLTIKMGTNLDEYIAEFSLGRGQLILSPWSLRTVDSLSSCEPRFVSS